MITMKVEGLKALQDQLLELQTVVAVKALAFAARKAFMPVIEAAQRFVPTDSTALRDAIKITVKKPKSGAVVVIGLQIRGPKKNSKKYAERRSAGLEGVQNPATRWHFIEFGTKNAAAHPYIRPAFNANVSAVVETLKTELAKSIKRAIKRQAKAALKASGAP